MNCGLENDIRSVANFTRGLENLKIGISMGSFNPKLSKNDAKFEEELTCHFKVDMKNLTNFDLST